MQSPTLVALEFTVADLDQCVAMLAGAVGLTLVGRSRHSVFDAEVAQLQSGSVLINLLSPTDTGQGSPLPNPETRMSQMTFCLPGDDVRGLENTLVEAGAPVIVGEDDYVAVDESVAAGLLGTNTALLFCSRALLEEGPIDAEPGAAEPVP
jgi:hypothetical protein